jgi:hypothetical protein
MTVITPGDADVSLTEMPEMPSAEKVPHGYLAVVVHHDLRRISLASRLHIG